MTLLSETPATKGDIEGLRYELRTHYASKAGLADVRTEIADVRTEIANLKTDMAELKSDLIKWMVGLMVGAAAAATGFAVLIERIT